MGDSHARVWADCEAWPSVIDHHGVNEMNLKGQRYLEMCSFYKLASDKHFFQNTRSMHSADCNTDHNLVHSKIHFVPRKMRHFKTKSLPCINASRASCLITTPRLHETLKMSLDKGRGDVTTADAKWKQVRTNRGWRPLGRRSVVTRADSRWTGRK